MTRRYGRCCVYGPNYVKLSRAFAVQLLSMSIPHYTALPPARSDPHWPHSHAITASIRLALTHTPNLDSGNHDMSRLSALAYPNDSPVHGLTDIPLRLLSTDIGCGTLAPRSRRGTAIHTARDSNLDSGNHDMSLTATKLRTCISSCRCQSVSAHPLGHCPLLFSPNIAPALTSGCVRWRECEMHKLGYSALPQEIGDSIRSM
jgi:hypothetical protein